MTRTRFLHTADWQIGMRRHFLSAEALARYRQERIEAIAAMARVARERECAFAVVCGDVFEDNQVDRGTVGRTLEELAAFACPVYLLPGNHDPLVAGSVWRSRALERPPDHVHVLDGTAPKNAAPGVELAGAPWTSKHPRRDLVAEALRGPEPPPGTLRVLAAHGAVDRGAPDPDDPALISVENVERAIAAGRLHFLALGDRHSATEVSARIHYSGTPEVTDWTEAEPGHCLVVELDADACRVERHAVGRWRFLERRFELHDDTLGALADWLDAVPEKSRAVVKLRLAGALGLAARAALDALLARYAELLAGLVVRERGLAVVPGDLAAAGLELTGFARAAVDELAAQAAGDDEERARTARDALSLLYRLQAEESGA